MFNQLNNFFRNLHNLKQFRNIIFVILIAIFFYSRFTVIDGELLTEEWLFLSPGINLFNDNNFLYDWGILVPDGNPFHKPPLTSIIFGFFSNILNDPIASARLFTIIINLFGLLLIFIITKSLITCLFFTFSYFFLASSIIIQTDVLIFFGFLFLCIAQNINTRNYSYHLFIFIGFFILWTTKIESALIIFFCHIIYYFIIKKKKLILNLFIINLLSIFLTFVLVFFLSQFTNESFIKNILNIFYPIERILGQQADSLIFNFSNYIYSITTILAKLFEYGFLLETLILSSFIIFIIKKKKYQISEKLLFYIICFFIPTTIYLLVGYSGMQFPRYFIFPFYSLLIVFGILSNNFENEKKYKLSNFLIVLLLFLNVYKFYTLIKNQGNIIYQESGKKEIAFYLKDNQINGSLIAYENFSGYLKNNMYLWEVIKGYEINKKKVLKNLDKIDAVILKIGDSNNSELKFILETYQKNYKLNKIEFNNYFLWIKKS